MAGYAAILSLLVKADGISRTSGQLRSLHDDLDKSNRAADRSTGKMAALGGAAGMAAKTGIGALVVGLPLAGGKMVSLASDAQETASKFKTVFGKEAANATEVLDGFSKATGTSRYALREQAAQFQALIRPMGMSTKGASDMSVGMTKLATDLASFNNSSVEEAITALQSGLVGEAEPLRRFGVQLSAARVEAYAYANGIAKQGQELTAAQKAQASYAIIMKDTQLAQGDATKTADSFANQWKRLKSLGTDLATGLGVEVLPAVTAVVGGITRFIENMRSGEGAAGGFRDTAVAVFGAIRDTVGSVIGSIKTWFDGHRDDVRRVQDAVHNLGKAIAFVWEEWTLPLIRRVLPAIEMIVKGVFGVIGGVVKTLSSILTGDFGKAWEGVKEIFRGGVTVALGIVRGATAPFREAGAQVGGALKGALDSAWDGIKSAASTAWDAIKRYIVEPIREAASVVRNALGGGDGGLLGWLRARFDDYMTVAEKLTKPFVDAFGKIKGAIKDVLDFIGDLVDKVESVTDLIGKIKIPKISIPGIGGEGNGTTVGPLRPGLGVDSLNPIAAAFGNVVTSGYRPGDDGWHGQNRARDYAGGNMMGLARALLGMAPRLLELIYTPLGVGVKNGQVVPISFFGSDVMADHYDHVHVAMEKGGHVNRSGWAVVGERGPELAHLPGGTNVYSNRDSQAMLGRGGPVVHIDQVVVGSRLDENSFLERLAFKVATA